MELNREQIVKALERCARVESDCPCDCPFVDVPDCIRALVGYALALIRELTEECKKWQSRLKIECEYTKADTVRKMQERLKQYIDVGHYRPPTEICFSELDVANIIDKIAKEMLEEE